MADEDRKLSDAKPLHHHHHKSLSAITIPTQIEKSCREIVAADLNRPLFLERVVIAFRRAAQGW